MSEGALPKTSYIYLRICTNALGVKHECTPLIPQLGLKGECGVTFQRVRVPSVDPLLEFSQ